MRLDDCDLNVQSVVSAHLVRSVPEPVWISARDGLVIPGALFTLYAKADYLSFGSAPRFLNDAENILFSYFGMVLNGLRESLSDGDAELRLFVDAHTRMYDPLKKDRGESWDPSASDRARGHFRNLLVCLDAALDSLSDLLSLFFTGMVPGLYLGKASFTSVGAWLSKPLPPGQGLVTPQEHFLQRLHASLSPLVHPTGPDRDWLRLMRLYRNKAAHFSTAVFRYMGLQGKAGGMHVFLPRLWPFILERFMTVGAPSTARIPVSFEQFCRDNLMDQDMVAFAHGLRARVLAVSDTAARVLVDTYDQPKILDLNQAALDEIKKSTMKYDFQYFPISPSATPTSGGSTGGGAR
jgi:hypothetical protein